MNRNFKIPKSGSSLAIILSVVLHSMILVIFVLPELLSDRGKKEIHKPIFVSVISQAAFSPAPSKPIEKVISDLKVDKFSKLQKDDSPKKEKVKTFDNGNMKIASLDLKKTKEKEPSKNVKKTTSEDDEIKKLSSLNPSYGGSYGKDVSSVYSVINNPKIKSQTPPVYPHRAIKRGWQGIVVVEAVVSSKGYPKEIRVYRSSGFAPLDKAAIKAVRKWEFDLEGRIKNPNQYSLVRVPVNFVINQS